MPELTRSQVLAYDLSWQSRRMMTFRPRPVLLLAAVSAAATAPLLGSGCAEDLKAAGYTDGSTPGGGGDGGTSGGTFTPSNGAAERLTAGSATLMLSGEVTIDTDSGEITDSGGASIKPDGVAFTSETQSGGLPGLGIFSATEVIVEAGAHVDVRGENALVLMASGDVTVQGLSLIHI